MMVDADGGGHGWWLVTKCDSTRHVHVMRDRLDLENLSEYAQPQSITN